MKLVAPMRRMILFSFFLIPAATEMVAYVVGRFQILSGIIQFLPIEEIYPSMAAISLALGGGLGLVVSFLTIRRHLKV